MRSKPVLELLRYCVIEYRKYISTTLWQGGSMAVDLHTHSCYSDGTLTPAELVELAYEKKLSAIALTDHDTINGIGKAKEAAAKYPIKLISGIEISSLHDLGKSVKELHILGLGIDENSGMLLEKLDKFNMQRQKRNEKMLRLINEHVMKIDQDEFEQRFHDTVITRAHYAQFIHEKGAVSSVKEAFDRYLADGKPCYIPKEGITSKEVIECILEAKGHPVLAHPPQYRLGKTALDDLICVLKEYGIEGIETVYSTYTAQQERELRHLASKYKLHMTGGSDYHGKAKPDIQLGNGLGNLYVPDEFAQWLLA